MLAGHHVGVGIEGETQRGVTTKGSVTFDRDEQIIYQVFYSAPGRNRTYDTRFRKPMLYPLSYWGGAGAKGGRKPARFVGADVDPRF